MACYGESLQVVIDEAYCSIRIHQLSDGTHLNSSSKLVVGSYRWHQCIDGNNQPSIHQTSSTKPAQNLLISMQSVLLETLSLDICMMIGIQGPFSNEELVRLTGEFNVVYRRWLVDYAQIVLFLEVLGMHSHHTLQALDDELHCKVLHSIGHLTSIVEGIINIQVERNERNDADD